MNVLILTGALLFLNADGLIGQQYCKQWDEKSTNKAFVMENLTGIPIAKYK